MKNNDQYDKYIQQVWEAKDKIQQATQDMTSPEYWTYIHRRCQAFRHKYKAKYVRLSPIPPKEVKIA
ncbi:MAG: hypothetical protein HZA78_02420 [Candidatus Schekmanbacteria bacterium]|nr:hypothetical protein [Candidatus Schekmanbacteria bacterium]